MSDMRESAGSREGGVDSFEFLSATSPDPLILLDRGGRLVRVESRAAELLGRPAPELEGRSADDLLETDDRFAFRKALSVFDREGGRSGGDGERGPIRVRADVPRPDAEPVPVEFGLRRLPGEDDCVVLSLRDRTGGSENIWHSVRPLLASTLDAASVGIVATDLAGEILFFNRRFAEIWKIPPGLAREGSSREVVDHVCRRVSDPDALRGTTERLRRNPDAEHRHLLETDDGRRIRRHVRPRRVNGRLAGWVSTYRKLEDAGGERDLREPEGVPGRAADSGGEDERYRLLFDHNVAGVFKISLDGRIVEVNQAFAEMFGYDGPGELAGARAEKLYADPHARSRFQDALQRSGSVRNYELECVRRDGSSIWLLENSLLVDDPETGREVIVGTVIDISRRKRLEQELERMAYHDSLTGLPNRRLLREQAGRVLALADRGDHKVGLVYLDLARFKQVNDSLGHDAGDAVLKEVARRLDAHLRDSDIASRVGGDEFAVLLSEVSDADGAMAAAGRLRRIFRKPFAAREEEHALDARLGVALYPDHAGDFDALLTAADHAMYRLHSSLRAGVALFDPEARDAGTGRRGPAPEPRPHREDDGPRTG